jgi:hypothetical protein
MLKVLHLLAERYRAGIRLKLGKVPLHKNMYSPSPSMLLLPFYRRFFPLLRLSLFLLVVSTKLVCQGGWAPLESPDLPEGVRNHCIECLFALKNCEKNSKKYKTATNVIRVV